jgi:hypothetical protein
LPLGWIYRWLFLACFYYIWGLLPWNCSWCTTSFWHILHRKKVFSQNMAKFWYMTLLLCCWYWVCGDVVVILCCNRIKLRISLFFYTKKNCWHPKEREREREREREHDTTAALIIKWYVFEFGM